MKAPTLTLPRAKCTHKGGNRIVFLPLPVFLRRGEVRWGAIPRDTGWGEARWEAEMGAT